MLKFCTTCWAVVCTSLGLHSGHAQELSEVVRGTVPKVVRAYEFPGRGGSKNLSSADVEVGSRVLARRDGWVKISTADGNAYWVEQKDLQLDQKALFGPYRLSPQSNSAANRGLGGSN